MGGRGLVEEHSRPGGSLGHPHHLGSLQDPFFGKIFPYPAKEEERRIVTRGKLGWKVVDEMVAQKLGRQRAVCMKCGKGHRGACLRDQGKCFYYLQIGHKAKDCPKRKKQKAEVLTSSSQGDHCP
ncbi:Zinc finger, CCHC-type superfamily [Sesbania bispinosa]|nr:Zinc finger, CCHC-type superfamily [Sesbania bispinosa]